MLQGVRVVLDAAINVDKFCVIVIEHFHNLAARLSPKQHPACAAEHLNIASDVRRHTLQNLIAQGTLAANPSDKTIHANHPFWGEKVILWGETTTFFHSAFQNRTQRPLLRW